MTVYALIYSVILVNINKAFWIKLLKAYNIELRWDWIQKMISDNDTLENNTVKLLYCLIWKLIYFNNSEQGLHLCIPHNLTKEVFQLAHNELDYLRYAHTHECLMQGLYIHNLLKQLHNFI